eukprot:88546-Amphidinium_carterae.1
MKAVEQNGFALNYASVSLREDKEVVFKALAYAPDTITAAGPALLHDEDFCPHLKTSYNIVRFTMALSGASHTLIAEDTGCGLHDYEFVTTFLCACLQRHLPDTRIHILDQDGQQVPREGDIRHWPGLKARGKVSDYSVIIS